ncbi:MAG: hypothetical protein OXG78_01260 [Chloroflexi bacterium]|nr:hypothetical protein [Chloroflexota bacterium]
MSEGNQPSDSNNDVEQLRRLAEMLGLDIAPEELAALSNQLGLIESLEQAELHDHPPILRMDAGWHD